jgi:hypothetical protein
MISTMWLFALVELTRFTQPRRAGLFQGVWPNEVGLTPPRNVEGAATGRPWGPRSALWTRFFLEVSCAF